MITVTTTEKAPTFEGEDVGAFLTRAKRNFRMVNDAESDLRIAMQNDQEFRASKIWPDDIAADRKADGRPCLTINRIPQFLRQITNAQRASRPSIQVNPVDSGADPATAEAIQGIIRSIEVNSDADVAYSTGCDQQVTTGRGYWRVIAEYADDDGYEQVLSIKRIINPLTVYVDPSAVKADASDARFAFIIEDVPKDDFIAKYGELAATTLQFFDQVRDRGDDWLPIGKVRIAEYFYKVPHKENLSWIEAPDPDNPDRKKTTRMLSKDVPDPLPKGWVVVHEREVTRNVVKWCKMTGSQILEGNDDLTAGRDFPSKYIPIVQVLGDELNINGRVDLRGMVRDAKDPMIMYVFWANAVTEQIALAPRAPYIGVAGQFKGHENKWNTANRKNYGYLEYNSVNVQGQPAPPPQRQQFNAEIEAIVQAFNMAESDLMGVMGLYAPSLGAPGPEQSGKAILARQRQGELGNSNFMDNLGRAIRHTGRILLDMIPRIYTPVRILRILGVDEAPKAIAVSNGPMSPQDQEALKAASGIQGIYDISVGRYDVSISVGPAYASRRQEAVESMLQLINSDPAIAPVIADLMVGNMDWPGAARVAARLKKAVPPQFLSEEDGPQQPPPVPPQLFEQMKQENEQLKMQAQAKTQQIESEERMKTADRQSRERIAALQVQAQLLQTQATIDAKKTELMIKGEMDRLNSVLSAHMDAINNHFVEGEVIPPAAGLPEAPAAAPDTPPLSLGA